MRKTNNKYLQYLISNIWCPIIILTSCLFFISPSGKAQTATSSPYSRYGIGDINEKGFAQNFAMGGTTIAMQNDTIPMFFVNNGNPASYSGIRLTTAELGINYNRLQLQNTSTKQTVNSASVSNIILGFPFKKWWGASVGLLPLSSVGYKVSDHQEIDNVGGVDFLYGGTGGINQVYFGNGIKPFYGLPRLFLQSSRYQRLKQENNLLKINHILKRKKSAQTFSIGANASYLFGDFANTRRSIFAYNSSSFNTFSGTTSRVSDIYLDYGAQYALSIDSVRGRDLKEKVKIIFGATFSAKTNVNARIDSISYSYYNDAQGYERIKDTIQNTVNSKGTITLPLSFGFGLALKKGDKWLVAADYAIQNWSSYQAFNQSQGLKNSMRVSLGAQYIPNSKANGHGTYFKRVHYRMGIKYSQTALELKNTPLTEMGLSAGIGFPVGRNYLLQNFSMVNIGVEIGQRGTIEKGLIKEQYVKANIGFTINDRWFVKPKFE